MDVQTGLLKHPWVFLEDRSGVAFAVHHTKASIPNAGQRDSRLVILVVLFDLSRDFLPTFTEFRIRLFVGQLRESLHHPEILSLDEDARLPGFRIVKQT